MARDPTPVAPFTKEEQLWVVTDYENHWLWYGRGSQKEAVAGAEGATAYNPKSTLYLFVISGEIVIMPKRKQ